MITKRLFFDIDGQGTSKVVELYDTIIYPDGTKQSVSEFTKQQGFDFDYIRVVNGREDFYSQDFLDNHEDIEIPEGFTPDSSTVESHPITYSIDGQGITKETLLFTNYTNEETGETKTVKELAAKKGYNYDYARVKGNRVLYYSKEFLTRNINLPEGSTLE